MLRKLLNKLSPARKVRVAEFLDNPVSVWVPILIVVGCFTYLVMKSEIKFSFIFIVALLGLVGFFTFVAMLEWSESIKYDLRDGDISGVFDEVKKSDEGEEVTEYVVSPASDEYFINIASIGESDYVSVGIITGVAEKRSEDK